MALALVLALQDPGLSLYVWGEPDAKLLPFCAERKVTRLYLMFSGKETEALRAFVKSSREAKVQVHAMHPGDMAEWLDAFPAKFDHEAILGWVEAALRSGLFDGIHLDIEPHATEHWARHAKKLGEGYVELLRKVRARVKPPLVLSAAVPWNWDREELRIGEKLLIERVQDELDHASVMAYRGRNAAKVLEAIEKECAYKPVELIQETDPKAVEEGVPLHVGTNANLEAIFKVAREKFGPGLRLAVHHYATWRELAR
jgi:hypothetical protein